MISYELTFSDGSKRYVLAWTIAQASQSVGIPEGTRIIRVCEAGYERQML